MNNLEWSFKDFLKILLQISISLVIDSEYLIVDFITLKDKINF